MGFDELNNKLYQIKNNVEKGAAFEGLCEIYLKTLYRQVWSIWDDPPKDLICKNRNGIDITPGDTGIDIFFSDNNDIWAVQCKAVGKGKTLSKSSSKIDSFFTDCGRRRVRKLIVITNAHKVSENAQRLIKANGCWLIGPDRLQQAVVQWPATLPVKEKYLTFDAARNYIQRQGLRNVKAFNLFCKTGGRNNRFPIPTNPNIVYKQNGWKDWGDFLGTGNKSTRKKVWRRFNSAHQFVLKLELNNENNWRSYCNSGERPNDIPANPDKIYKSNGWIDWPHWLTGKERVAYLNFDEAREWALKQEIKNQNEWRSWGREKKIPANIPLAPDGVYKQKGWKGWGDFLGTGNLSNKEKGKVWRDFGSAHQFVINLKLNGMREWRAYYKSGKRPNDIPANPDKIYKSNGWIDWPHWLTGKERVAYLNYDEAREWALKQGIKNSQEWKVWIRNKKIPPEIPRSPDYVYRQSGWRSWSDFLKKWMPYKEARKWARESGITSIMQWKKYLLPKGIPRTPEKVYKSEWRGWGDWLNYRA